jgi:hypothetical protein
MKYTFTRPTTAPEAMPTPCTSLNQEKSPSPLTRTLYSYNFEYSFVCMLTRAAVVQFSGFVRVQCAQSTSPLPCRSSQTDRGVILQIVFNPPTYPNFLRFLALQKRSVEVIKTQMTFSVSRDGGAFEWAGDGLRSVFCQPRRVFDLGMWRMLFDIMRFNACAVRVLTEKDGLSIGEYLQREGYSSQFRDDYLIVCFLLPFVLLISHWFRRSLYCSP